MDAFLNWFFAFITTMFSGIWQGIKNLFLGFVHIFDFGTYFDLRLLDRTVRAVRVDDKKVGALSRNRCQQRGLVGRD